MRSGTICLELEAGLPGHRLSGGLAVLGGAPQSLLLVGEGLWRLFSGRVLGYLEGRPNGKPPQQWWVARFRHKLREPSYCTPSGGACFKGTLFGGWFEGKQKNTAHFWVPAHPSLLYVHNTSVTLNCSCCWLHSSGQDGDSCIRSILTLDGKPPKGSSSTLVASGLATSCRTNGGVQCQEFVDERHHYGPTFLSRLA